MFELRLLGALEIRAVDGRNVEPLVRQSKRTGLLAYLAAALPRGLHRRDKLLALFWPESDEAHARAALSQALYVLRNTLGDQAVVTRGEVEVGLSSEFVWCDAAAFDSALDGGRPAEALALYRGQLLDGFFVTGAPEFERWLDAERARLTQRASEGAWALAETSAADGDAVEAERWARRAGELRPDDEAVIRRLMTFLQRLGDKAAAIRAYEAFAWRLAQEHELEPSAETQALAAAIRGEERRPVASRSAELAAPSLTQIPTARRQVPAGWLTAVTVAGGSVRTRKRGRTVAVGATVAVGIVGVLVGAALLARRHGAGDTAAASRVVVLPFENRTGVTELDPLGTMAAEWVTQGLTEVPFLTVLDTRGAQSTARGTAAIPVTVGRETGAAVVVAGSYFLQGESLRFEAQIASTADGSILFAIGGVTAARDQPMAGIEQVRQRVLGGLASLLDRDVTSFQTSLAQPPTYAAWREYVEGLELYMGPGHYLDASQHFRQAVALDSTFLTARVWAAQTGMLRGEAWADSLISGLQLIRYRLAPFDRARLDFIVALKARDLLDAYRAALRLVDASPGSVDAQREAAISALRVLRPREALRRMEQLDPEHGLMREWDTYSVVAWGDHLLGQHEAELAAVRRGRQLHPSSPFLLYLELRALAALGGTVELDSLARAELPASSGQTGVIAFGIAGELMAHGHAEAARRLAQYASEHPGAPPPSGQQAAQDWLDQQRAVRREVGDPYAGEHPEARPPAERAADWWLHWRAELALLVGDAETAASRAAQLRDPAAHGLLLARILAAQGRFGAARTALEHWEGSALQARGNLRGLEIDRASVLVGLGDMQTALEVLSEGLGRGAIFNTSYGQDGHAYPDLAPLWSNPRFRALIKPRG